MAKANVLQLVADMGNGLADATAVDVYYDNVVADLAIRPEATMVDTINQAITPPADGVYVHPFATATYLLDVIFDGVELMRGTVADVTMYDPDYILRTGTPMVWIEEHEDYLKARLFPRPTLAPTWPIQYIYAEIRADVHLEEELAVALEVLAREMSRDSDHTDKTLAQAARSLSALCFELLGLALVPPRLSPEEPRG